LASKVRIALIYKLLKDFNIYTRRGVGEASQVMSELFGISSRCGISNTLSLRWDFQLVCETIYLRVIR